LERRKTKAIAAIRAFNDERSLVRVQFGPMSARPPAREIADMFELAGWRCLFMDIAQESMTGYPYREGIEVSGVNEYLISKLSEALTSAGMTGVRHTVKQHNISPKNPKYPYIVREVEVHVGHPAQPKAERRRKALALAAAGAVIPIALGVVTEFATEWKTNSVAWLALGILAVASFAWIYIERSRRG
jgi:hypothetical protein